MRILLRDLTPNTAYKLQLQAKDSGGRVSAWSKLFDLVTTGDTVAPATPTGVTNVNAGTSFKFSWNAVTTSADGTPAYDLAGYVVRVSNPNNANTRTYKIQGTTMDFSIGSNILAFVSAQGTVRVEVAAIDSSGNTSPFSAMVSASNPAPGNPTNFTSASIPDAVTFKWDATADTDLAGYRIYMGTSAGSQTTPVWSGMATTATVQSFDYTTDRWYKVAAYDVFGTESPVPPVTGPIKPKSTFTVDTVAPATPTGLAATLTNATDGKSAKAAVTWTAVTDTDGDLSEYIIDYKPSTETAWNTVKVDYEKTAVALLGLVPFVNYDFRIRSSDWSANLSAWSSTLTKTATANAAPADIGAGISMTPGKDSVTIKWTASTDPDVANGNGTYNVEIATNNAFTTGLLQYNTGANQIVVTGLAQGTIYYARVKAVDAQGLASVNWSSVASTTTGTLSNFKYTTNATAPSSPSVGDIWMDTTSGFEKQWSGSAWVNTGNASINYVDSSTANLIKTYVNEYAVNSSETVAPTTGWSTTQPARTPGTFVWFRTTVTYQNNSTATTAAALLTGNTGATGAAGTNAANIVLTATTQVLSSPAGGGATTPATSTVTGTAVNTTINAWTYSVDGAAFSATVPAGVSRTGNVVTITGATMTAKTITVQMSDGTVGDTMTIAKVSDGATGATGGAGTNGADGYTVLLSNEAQTFAAGTTNALAATGTSTVIAYKGTVAQTATVGTITGGATGITAAVTNNGTTAPLITFTVTTALTTANGTFTIPVTVGGITFNQVFTWSLAFSGAAGANAKTIALTATSQVLASPAGGGATTPATSTVTGTPVNTTITAWDYSVDGAAFSATVPAGVSRAGNVVTITGSTMTARTIAVRMSDGTVSDTLTVAKAFDGAAGATGGTGGTGPAGADAYTVLLTNEAQTFAAGTTNAFAASTTATVVAYKGTVLQTATVGTITGGATGITAAVTNNGTTAPLITFTVTTALSTANGTFTIPVTVGGITFNQVFTWSLAFTGTTGATGATGKGVSSFTPYYYQTSATASAPATPTASPPPAPWTSTEPTYSPNTALWRSERIVYSDSTFAYTVPVKSSSYDGTRWLFDWNISRGTDLVTNGTGSLGTNYNFSFATVSGDAPPGAAVSFLTPFGSSGTRQTDEIMPVDVNRKYKLSAFWRQTQAGSAGYAYMGLYLYDAAKLGISPYYYMYVPNTTTTLAAPLNPGDTTITLTSSANWYGLAAKPAGSATYNRTIIWWDYTDPLGKTWPVGTYSRNWSGLDYWADGGITGNVITLRAPYSGPARPAGTALSNGTSGGSYLYANTVTNVLIPETWTNYSATITGTAPSGASASMATGWPAGTAYCAVVFLPNRTAAGASLATSQHAVAGVSFSDATAAADDAATAIASANGKNKIIYSTSVASGANTAGDTWFQQDGTGKIIGQWIGAGGTTWNSVTIRSEVIANLDAGKLTANSAFVTTLNVGTGGVIQSAGYTSGGNSGFQLSTSGLTIKGTNNSIDVNSIISSTLSATTITLGANGIINIDSTGSVKSNNYAAGSTGYKLSNTGLELNDGTVDAKTLKTGSAIIGDLTIGRSADALGTIKSFDYVAGSAGWKIGKGLFEINSGTIKASALQLQTGHNMMPAAYADFEYGDYFYVNPFWNPRGGNNVYQVGLISIDSTDAKFGKQSLQLYTFSPASGEAWLAPTTTTYNIQVDPGAQYYFSVYMKNYAPTAETWVYNIIGNNGSTIATGTFNTGASETTFNRYGMVVNVPASGVTACVVKIVAADTTRTKGMRLDGVQFEPITGGLVQASVWKPPATTTLDASGLITGYLRSNQDVTVGGVVQPSWSLNKAGNIQVGDALVRGKFIIGNASDNYVNKAPNNGNFEANVTGYAVYHIGATSPAIVRTTTVGEVISGTGSAKVTAAAGTKSALGLSFNLPATVNTVGTAVRVKAKVKTNTSDYTAAIGVSMWSASLTNVNTTSYTVPVANTVYSIDREYVLQAGENINTILIYINGTNTATSVIFDDITVTVDNEIGPSFMASANYIRNTAGWKLDSLGNLEANQGDFRGALRAGVTGEDGVLHGGVIQAATITGDKISADAIDGRIITGATVQTAASGDRSVMDRTGFHIDSTDADGTPITTTRLGVPPTATTALSLGATASSGGTFGAGTYYWIVTALTPAGETKPSNEVAATLVANGTQTLSWTSIAGATTYYVYRGTASGDEGIRFSAGTALTFTDTGAVGTAAYPTQGGNALFLADTSGNVNAFIGPDGNAALAGLSISGTDTNSDGVGDSGVVIYGTDFADWLYALPRGVVAYGTRSATQTLTTTEAAFHEVSYSAPATDKTWRMVRITAVGMALNNTASARCNVSLRYTSDGSSPNTTSTLLSNAYTPYNLTTAGSAQYPFVISYVQALAPGVTYRWLISCAPLGGGSAQIVSSPAQTITIEDIGPQVTDVGLDRTGGTPPPTKQTYTTTWPATASQTYYPGGSTYSSNEMVQGNDGTYGNRYAQVVFAGNSTSGQTGITIATALTGATISKVEVYLYANHWWYNAGGTGIIRAHNSTSVSSTPDAGTYKSVTGWTANSGKWVDITSIATSSIRGVQIGQAPSSAQTYYGRFNGNGMANEPQLRITYTK